jgi:hypothetical protein
MKAGKLRRRPLSVREILRWADAYREATGYWPQPSSGSIPGTVGETWGQVNQALYKGVRSLPGELGYVKLQPFPKR